MTQLANAFEQGALSVGDKVCLVVESGGKEGVAFVRLNITTNSAPLELDNLSFF